MILLTSGIDKIQTELDTIKNYVGLNSVDHTSQQQSSVKLSTSEDEDDQNTVSPGQYSDGDKMYMDEEDLHQDLNLTETVWVDWRSDIAPSKTIFIRPPKNVQQRTHRRG